MDYLDPQKKKRKKLQLLIMYALVGVAIAIASLVLVFMVNGYTIDRQTGEVVQDGLIYVDSKPESAKIFLNGEEQRGRTDARLVLPEGNYNIQLKRDGYRDWSRSLTLEGGSLRRISYARLVPENIETELGLNIEELPTMSSQSIDKRWLVFGFKNNVLDMRIIDLERPELQLSRLPLPTDLIDTKEPGNWEVIDWAEDNKTFLAVYKTKKTAEYVLINREDINKTKKLKIIFTDTIFSEVSLRDRKNNLVYLFNEKTGVLYSADVNKPAEIKTELDEVIVYKAYEQDSILYLTQNTNDKNSVTANLRKGQQTYKLRDLKKSENYLLDISKIGNALVIGMSSPAEDRAIIYNDPIEALKQNDFSTIPVPTTVLKVNNPQELEISADSSVIAVRGGQVLATHEFEEDRSYTFKINEPIDKNSKLRWIDGRHMVISVEGNQTMFDYDGSNPYKLVESNTALGVYLDRDLDFMFSFLPPSKEDEPSRIMRSYMRTPEDR